MIFSCLVDADFLNTEDFMTPQQAALRENWPDEILEQMDNALTEHVHGFDPKDTMVNRQRALGVRLV